MTAKMLFTYIVYYFSFWRLATAYHINRISYHTRYNIVSTSFIHSFSSTSHKNSKCMTLSMNKQKNSGNSEIKLDTTKNTVPVSAQSLPLANVERFASDSSIAQQNDKSYPKPPRLNIFQKIKRFLSLAVPLLKKMVSSPVRMFKQSANKSMQSANKSGNPKFKKGSIIDIFKKVLLSRMKSPRFWVQLSALIASAILVRTSIRAYSSLVMELSYSSFMNLISKSPERISNLKVTPFQFSYLLDGQQAAFSRSVQIPPSMIDRLLASGVEFSAASPPINIFGLFTTLAYLYYLFRMSKSFMGPPEEGVGKRVDGRLQEYGNLSYDDIAGQEKAKQEVSEICAMLKNPEKYSNVGARLPAGVLLVGPPGTGKTLLARVTAAECNVPFLSCSGSDFVEVFVGRGPARVRQLFKQAAKNPPSIIFIDELDSIGRSRRQSSMNSEQESTLNQLLTAMDGLDTSNNGVIVMAATNRYELLDPALLRAGRFDRIIECPLPDRIGRLAILNVHTRRLKLDPDIDLDRLARLTPGTCGADLATIVNEAAIRTARRGGTLLTVSDFDEALRSFYSTRGAPLSSMLDNAGVQIPAWLKQITGVGKNSETQSNAIF